MAPLLPRTRHRELEAAAFGWDCKHELCDGGAERTRRRGRPPRPTARQLGGLVLSSCALLALGAGGDEEESEVQLQVKFVAAWILLGSVAMIMSVFYLVNYPDKDIRKATWVTISNTASLFCAILIFRSVDRVVHLLHSAVTGDWSHGKYASRRLSIVPLVSSGDPRWILSDGRRMGAVETDPASIAITMSEFVGLFLLVEVALILFRKTPKSLCAWGLIGAHIVGFAALDAFYPFHVMAPFSNGPAEGFLVVLCATGVLLFMFTIGGVLRKLHVTFHEGGVDEFEELWLAQCTDSEDECTAFAIGFLISVVVRHALHGDLPALHWLPEDTANQFKTMGLLGISAVFALIVIISSFIRTWVEDDDAEHRSPLERMADLFSLTMAMSTGWCMLFWGHWQFWLATNGKGLIGDGNLMVFSIVIVLLFTFICFSTLIVLDYLADRFHSIEEGLRALQKTFVLLLGLSWEAAFNSACFAVQKKNATAWESALWQVSVALVLCMMVIPAWIMFILPKALMVNEGGRLTSAGATSGRDSLCTLEDGSEVCESMRTSAAMSSVANSEASAAASSSKSTPVKKSVAVADGGRHVGFMFDEVEVEVIEFDGFPPREDGTRGSTATATSEMGSSATTATRQSTSATRKSMAPAGHQAWMAHGRHARRKKRNLKRKDLKREETKGDLQNGQNGNGGSDFDPNVVFAEGLKKQPSGKYRSGHETPDNSDDIKEWRTRFSIEDDDKNNDTSNGEKMYVTERSLTAALGGFANYEDDEDEDESEGEASVETGVRSEAARSEMEHLNGWPPLPDAGHMNAVKVGGGLQDGESYMEDRLPPTHIAKVTMAAVADGSSWVIPPLQDGPHAQNGAQRVGKVNFADDVSETSEVFM